MAAAIFRRSALACAAALAVCALPLGASAANSNMALQAQMQALLERIERLEAKNSELRSALAAPALHQRIEQLEVRQQQAESALATERISENEPELVTRLKAVEFQQASMQKPVQKISALDGILVNASLTGMVQQARRESLAAGDTGHSRSNYRGDLALALPGGELGQSTGSIFVHARFGQGEGLALRPTYTASGNSTAFQVHSADSADAQPIVAQAWYQLSTPLGGNGMKQNSRETARLTFGKIDPFVFFDQNSIADDETRRFANNVFVHNPLLDSGGDAGVDPYGFTPGAIAAYENASDKSAPWGLSLGIFGAGNAASFNASPGKPFVIAQAWLAPRINALPGNYRVYAWSNARASQFDGRAARHSGFGASLDQRVTEALTLFGRYGQQTSGLVRFDRATTAGGELGGGAWGRGADGVGLALGWLRTSRAFGAASAALDADGDGIPDYGYGARGGERVAELYYRYRVNNHLEITPDLQWIGRPGGDPGAKAVKLFALRARVGF